MLLALVIVLDAGCSASLRHVPTAATPNQLAAPQNLVVQNHFVAHRYNLQFSDNEIRSVQAALRRIGIYSGQVDKKRPVTGQPDR